mmetsp:Transcript_50132/g.106682  ORF Transcript_50132/g.106682 Transcript_50132/m.106682 type:complete len:299 (-) Transcript_50132:809-1705(-)
MASPCHLVQSVPYHMFPSLIKHKRYLSITPRAQTQTDTPQKFNFILSAKPKSCTTLGSRVEQIQRGVPFREHPRRHRPVVLAPVPVHVRVPHRLLVFRDVRDRRGVVAIRPILRAGLHEVHSLDDVADAAVLPRLGVPVDAAALEVSEQVQALEVRVRRHPRGVVGAVDARGRVDVGVVRVVVDDGHGPVVGHEVLIAVPVIGTALRDGVLVFVGTVGRPREEPVAALLSRLKEVELLEAAHGHPRGVVDAVAAVVHGIIGEVVISSSAVHVGLVFGFGVHGWVGVRTARATRRIPAY